MRLPVVQGVERVAGLQAQLGSTPYVGLWTRLDEFKRSTLERALLRGAVSRGVLMRGTVHVVSTPDYGMFSSALDITSPGWVTPEIENIAKRVAAPLREYASQPRTRAEVFEWLERDHGIITDGSNGIWYAMRLEARIGHAPEASLWGVPPQGMKVGDFLDNLDGLRRLRDDRGRELLDLPRAPLPAADTPAPVRFLPKFDNVLIDRERVLPDEYRKVVVRKNADVQPTFIVDGLVAGVWRVERKRVVTEPFTPLPRTVRRELDDEAARLEAWLLS